MQITEVKLKLGRPDGKMRASAAVTFDNVFVVHNIKVIERAGAPLLIAMPSRRNSKGVFVDIAHPINAETRTMIEKAVLEEYERMLKTGDSGSEELEESEE